MASSLKTRIKYLDVSTCHLVQEESFSRGCWRNIPLPSYPNLIRLLTISNIVFFQNSKVISVVSSDDFWTLEITFWSDAKLISRIKLRCYWLNKVIRWKWMIKIITNLMNTELTSTIQIMLLNVISAANEFIRWEKMFLVWINSFYK